MRQKDEAKVKKHMQAKNDLADAHGGWIPKEKTKYLNFGVPETLHIRVKLLCVRNSISMQRFITQAIENEIILSE